MNKLVAADCSSGQVGIFKFPKDPRQEWTRQVQRADQLHLPS